MPSNDIKERIKEILIREKISKKKAEQLSQEIINAFQSPKDSKQIKVKIFIDGGSRGNPGRGASAFIIYHNDKKILEGGKYYEHTTNNEAEYNALILALKESIKINISDIEVFTDSELLSRQITKKYKVKSSSLLVLYNEVMNLIKGFNNFSIAHISREQNKEADRLVNFIIDTGKDFINKYNE